MSQPVSQAISPLRQRMLEDVTMGPAGRHAARLYPFRPELRRVPQAPAWHGDT